MSSFAKRFGSKMLVLSEKDVRKCLTMESCIKINKAALMSIASPSTAALVGGKGNVPPRLGLSGAPTTISASAAEAEDWTLFKPAAFYADDGGDGNGYKESLMGMKIVSIRAQNPDKGLPLVPATILVVDAESGIVQAVLDGTYLTGIRTAASSGIATQLMRPDLNHVVVFGAGLQAECHIEAIETAIERKIPKITIVNRSLPRAEALREKISCEDCDIVLLNDKAGVEKALSAADVVAATTNSTTPLFDGSVLPSGCHVNGIGSYTPEMQEIPANAVNRSRVIIDTPDAKTVGDLKHLQANTTDCKHPMVLLGDVLANTTRGSPWPLLSNEDASKYDCTFFKGVGTAIQDVMTADMVVKRARELGIGTEVDMS